MYLLEIIQNDNPFIGRFNTWGEVLLFMRKRDLRNMRRKDEILRSILLQHSKDFNPQWRTILLTFLWPGLANIARQKRIWDFSARDRWQNIVFVFLQYLCSLNLGTRRNRMAQKLINGTARNLYRLYNGSRRYSEHESAADSANFDTRQSKNGSIDINEIECQTKQDVYSRHLSDGRILRKDFKLLVATRIEGKTVAQYAREVGMTADQARKRRMRRSRNPQI